MTTTAETKPHSDALNPSKPIALRLTNEALERTQTAAQHAGHRPTGFVRHLYMQALANYEAKHGLVRQ
jgi:hypothetical protein